MNDVDRSIREKLDLDASWLSAANDCGLDEVDAAEVTAEHGAYQRAILAVLDRCARMDTSGTAHTDVLMRAVAYAIRRDMAKALGVDHDG